ncbi:MAG: efflux RND transporter permease subunit [Holophagae bacterium]|jgi:multidrug efflux pump subunit AcrB/outer membrane protein TolC
MPHYWGQAVAVFPGADAEMVERLVLEPIEDALAEVEDVKTIESTAYAETAVIQIDLDESIDDTDEAWSDVRQALATAHREFPAGVGLPLLNDKLSSDHDAVVLALTGSPEPLELLEAARTLRKGLLDVPDVARVRIVGDPGEQVTIELDDAAARRTGLSAGALASQLQQRTRILAGGTLSLGDRTVRLRPLSELESVEEIAASPIRLPSGATVPLGEVAKVRIGPREPAGERMRFNGEMAVGLGIVAKEKVNAVRFGDTVRARIDELTPTVAPIQVQTVAFQPQRVETRLAQLNESLLFGILIVAGVVILAMGLRLGLVVASVVPLVAFAGLAVFAIGGGVLHQISIAALVLALGMLVDNAIVVAESVQWRLDRGSSPRAASLAAVRDLAVPLAAATGTTVAAFLPMLLSQSGTADFTRSIPIVVIVTLTMSYVFAVTVTPILARMALRPGTSRATAFTARVGSLLSRLAVGRTRWVLTAAVILVIGSGAAAGLVRQQFFPGADRNQFVIDLKLPEGAHLDATDRVAREVEQRLRANPDVVAVASFMGRGAPRFYYNIQSVPWSPHFAQLMITTRTAADVDPVLAWLRSEVEPRIPSAEIIGRKLEQGPPVAAPIEIRVFGEEPEALYAAVTAVSSELRSIEGAVDVRHDLGPGEPTLRFEIDDAAAARYGLSRTDVAMALYGHTRGLPVGELRSKDDPVPIVIRSAAGEHTPADALAGLDVSAPGAAPVPLSQLARVEASWKPAAIHHRDRQRLASVFSQLGPGATFSDVSSELVPRLESLELPEGVTIAFGGDAEGSGEANAAILQVLPIGALLLLGVLLAEFNSFRRVLVILVTVPLAATGVVPGLLLTGQPFGFMSLLGVFALIGVVVNNAIVLLEVVEQRRRDGATVDDALTDAIHQRIRPILLTTATTVAGLLPLAVSPSTLWPPMAWAMISGLLASTFLTLVVVPALYRALFLRSERRAQPSTAARRQAAAAAALGVALVLPGVALAADETRLDLTAAMRLGMERPAAQAAMARADAAESRARAERRLAFMPVLGLSASTEGRDRELELQTPIGSFPFGADNFESAGVEIRQPVLDPSRLLHGNPAARDEARAQRLGAERSRQNLAAAAASAYLEVLAIDARRRATQALIESLGNRLAEVTARVDEGRALRVDALKIRQALERAELERLALDEGRAVALLALAQAVGSDDPVRPATAPDWLRRSLPEIDEVTAAALERRDDLASLSAAAEAAAKRRAQVRAELIPRLDARASYVWSNGTPYAQDSWVEGGLFIRWTPVAAGTRGPRVAALAHEKTALERDLAEAVAGLKVEIRGALAELALARDAVEVGRRGVEQALETVRVDTERFNAGRLTTNDLLEAEALLREQRTLFEIARLDVVRAWVRLWLAAGFDDPEELDRWG